ncbi:MAG TPA: NAD(P)-dependent alcohol dehydrogenase [Planctomicrobium sp.]|nr:NAD(P)-dependent alcohol dehydrogenase [Planctomicrobium sp.]
MATYEAWVASGAGEKLTRQSLDPGPLGAEEVEVRVEHCGLCHSDLSVLNNGWGSSTYPAVLGHEIIGQVVATGSAVKGLKPGDRVGIGWNSQSCMHCRSCMTGTHQLCHEALPTILGHYGGFASHVRAHWAWTIPLPENLNLAESGPLLCGGITVFNPLTMYVKPTDHVGIVGIGGLGHLGVKFAAAYGCEVTAFTSSESKFEEARSFGAHHVVSSRDSSAIAALTGKLDLLIVTVNVTLDWNALVNTLSPNGRLHVVGAVLEPMAIAVLPLIFGQKSVSGSPTGSPVDIADMLSFAARHNITPQTEHFPMSRINDAFDRLASGKARYRIVLDADF